MICRKVFFLAGLTLCVSLCSYCQTVTSARNGSWNDPSTWDSGVVPDSSNSTLIRILHDVFLSAETQSYSLEIRGWLHIRSDALLQVNSIDGVNGFLQVNGGRMDVDGALVGRDGVTYVTSPSNCFFSSTGRFHFRGGPKSYIPLAHWDVRSTLVVEGFKSSGYVALAYSAGWRQDFGNVIYDCPSQTAFVDLNGHLRSIRGDLLIKSTNSNALRFSTTQRPLINIGGNLVVEGRSEVWFNTTGDSTRIFIGGDFIYRSTSTGPSYIATRGRTFVRVGGRAEVNSAGPLRFCSGSVDSTGVRRTTFEFLGDVRLISGGLISPSPGRGTFIFSGSQLQSVSAQANAFNGNFNWVFARGSIVDLGLSRIAGNGTVHVKGHLKLGSTSTDGALHPITGNINTIGLCHFQPGSTIEYNGLSPQGIGLNHPSDSAIHLVVTNNTGVTLARDLWVKDLIVNGSLHRGEHDMKISGHVTILPASTVSGSGRIELTGGKNQLVSFANNIVESLDVRKNSGTGVTLSSPLLIRRRLSIYSGNTRLESAGHLTLLSLGDGIDSTATLSGLPSGSQVSGNVTVQRHMRGEGRLYRYISSPVMNETVAGLKDDFPVTGSFLDPSVGPGLNTTGASLYYYDESLLTSPLGWIPYPTSGFASENRLLPGRGYAAYIRKAEKATTIDFSGVLNQGEISIPVQYTPQSPESVRGWNLIGNPYPASIDWASQDGWSRSGDVSNTFAIRDNAAGRFHYSDGEIGDLEEPVIASGQSFWIRTSAPNPYVVINELAKVNTAGEFFRKPINSVLDYLKITIRGNGHHDNVYLRKRRNASAKLDVFDATKMPNDALSLSVLSADSVRLAINAMDVFSCSQRLPLALDLPVHASGYYTFEGASHGLFKNARIMIYDHLTDSVSEMDGYRFKVNSTIAFRDSRRFTLIVEAQEIEPPAVSVSRVKCNERTTRLTLKEKERGSFYVLNPDGTPFDFMSMDSLQTVTIPLGRSWRKSGKIHLYYRGLCGDRLIQTVELESDDMVQAPELISAIQCGDGAVNIRMKASGHPLKYNVYAASADSAAAYQSATDTFSFHAHGASKMFLSAENEEGCLSDRLEVHIEKRSIPEEIIEHRNGVLYSTRPGAWYNDGDLLSPDSVSSIQPSVDGLYSVRSFVNGCVSEASYVVGFSDDIEVSPVPFDDRIFVRSRRSANVISRVRLYTMDGKLLIQSESADAAVVLKTEALSRGIYVLEIYSTNGSVWRKKVVK